jgi:two-component system phosphate regulon response regulator PhoB
MTPRSAEIRESTTAGPYPHGAIPTMAKPKILVIEDERSLVEILSYNLVREGFDVLTAYDGQDGLRQAQLKLPDLVVLDLMLPVKSGLDVCRDLRRDSRTREIPIIMLTAKAEESDQLIGFATGADDYVTKPYSTKVLVQRIRRELRRRQGADDGGAGAVYSCHGVVVDRHRHRALCNNEELALTPTEFRLLETLLRQPGRAFNRHELMDAAIGEDAVVLERTIDVHVKSLRKKMGEAADLIETVRGVGYRFREPRLVES